MARRLMLISIVFFLCAALVVPLARVAEASEYKGELLAVFSTDYSFSSEGRKKNVELASKRINGVVVKSGEIFSFNDVTLARTEQNGYVNSPIIEKGKYTLGIGGGVCQVSTTLYNAVIRAGLKVVAVSPHSLQISYVKPSMDAMVSQATDFRFFNDTPFGITIESETKNDVLTFRIYGFRTITDGEEIRFVSKIVGSIPATYQEVIDDGQELGEGEERKVVKKAKDGVVSECYKEIYYLGKLIKSVRIRRDTYAPQDGVVLVRAKEQKEEINCIA